MLLDQRVAVGDPLRVGREAVLGRVPRRTRAHSARHSPSEPQAIWIGAVPVANMPYGAIDGWWSPARPGHLAGHGPPGALEGVHADHAGQQRGAHDAAAAGAGPLVQRGEHAVGAVHAGDQVGDRHPDLGRLLGAGDRHQPALALGDLVVAGARRLGPVVAEAGDRQDDQAAG